MSWSRYAALGDSFTEGLDDPYPDGRSYRGWADLVAGHLGIEYANLAVRGRLFDAIIAEQVEPALAMKPDLISFAAGGNDVLRRHCDPPTLMRRFEETIKTFRGTGSDVIVFRFANVTTRLPATRMIAPRVAFLNRAVGEIAEATGAYLVDLWSDDEFLNPALWGIDRLHMSAAGHQRTAAHVLTALGRTPDPSWWRTPAYPALKSWPLARADDFAWAAKHLAPWIKRRLTGRSSGDLIEPKRPNMGPIG